MKRLSERSLVPPSGYVTATGCNRTANLSTNIVDFRGFDSSIILIQRGGILMSIGNFLESLSQAMLVEIMLVGRLGVMAAMRMIVAIVATETLLPCHRRYLYCCYLHL